MYITVTWDIYYYLDYNKSFLLHRKSFALIISQATSRLTFTIDTSPISDDFLIKLYSRDLIRVN